MRIMETKMSWTNSPACLLKTANLTRGATPPVVGSADPQAQTKICLTFSEEAEAALSEINESYTYYFNQVNT